jgi:hypothetical protein
MSRNSGASASWNPKGLSRPVAGKLYLFALHNKHKSFIAFENFFCQFSKKWCQN